VAGVTHSQRPPRVYPRTARLNRLMREIVADELERIDDERLEHVAVTGVDVETGIQHATVWFDSYAGPEADEDILAAFAEHRVRLQSAIGRQARVKRTPLLSFRPDIAVRTGERIDEVLRQLPPIVDRPEEDGDQPA
jgi:ribosome-binding factor A